MTLSDGHRCALSAMDDVLGKMNDSIDLMIRVRQHKLECLGFENDDIQGMLHEIESHIRTAQTAICELYEHR